jgi:hypothetical protein
MDTSGAVHNGRANPGLVEAMVARLTGAAEGQSRGSDRKGRIVDHMRRLVVQGYCTNGPQLVGWREAVAVFQPTAQGPSRAQAIKGGARLPSSREIA